MDEHPRQWSRPGIIALAALTCTDAVAIVAASLRPGPRNWGIHLPAFLPFSLQALVFIVLTLAACLVVAGVLTANEPASGGSARPISRRPPKHKPRRGGATQRGAATHRSGATETAWIAALLVGYGFLLFALRASTHFLGDGIVWMKMVQGGAEHPYNEPLAAWVWKGFMRAANALGISAGPGVFAMLPILCGIVAAGLARLIAQEAVEGRARWIAWGLFLTAGLTQLYYGYIESYPVVTVAMLATLWLALRHARGADPPWLLGVVFAVTIATHLVTVFLVPAYMLAVAFRTPSWMTRAWLAVLPLALAPLFLSLAGSPPEAWLEPFRTAAQASLIGHEPRYLARPYGTISLGHAADLANAILLAIPAPAILLGAWIVAHGKRPLPKRPVGWILGLAALGGFAVAAILSPPVAPSQDWDLTATLLLPAAIAGAVLGARALEGRPRAAMGLLALGAASLLAFVFVNASLGAGVRRFEMLMGPDARISAFGRGYGNSMLSEFFEDRQDEDSALRTARAALDAEPTNARYWVRVGTILYNQGRYPEAIRNLEEGLQRGTTRPEAHNNLGLCYARTGRPADAAGQFRIAIAMDPDRPDYRHNLGLMLFDSGERDSAKAVWTDVLRRWPDYDLTRRAMERRFGPTPASP